MNYDEMLSHLKSAREDFLTAKEGMREIIFKATQGEEYKNFELTSELAQKDIAEIEAKIKEFALGQYLGSGEKKPHPKVSVKVFKVVIQNSAEKVRAWVEANLRDALVVDQKKVEKYAKEIGTVDGMEVKDEPRVQIASEL